MKLKKFLPYFIVLLLFFGMAGNLVSVILSDKLSEISTVERSAVFDSAECVDSGKDISWIIHVKEPEGTLLIPATIGNYIDKSAINALQAGQAISYRMDLANDDLYQQDGTAHIVALKAGQEILSLDDYNSIMHQEKQPALIAGLVFEAVLCVLLIYLARKNKICALFRRKQSQ